ncbi:MAG TPA: signal peptide peptidase SppA [Alphaproteobacteria bacterium]|nr:signal peptide peptidase SppA [Alphaproteobacteria bacterium]
MALNFVYEPAKKSVLSRIAAALNYFFCIIGVFVCLIAAFALWHKEAPLSFKENTALRLSFDTDLYEDRPSDLAGALTFGNPPTVADVVLGLNRAAKDPKITALVGYLPSLDLSLAQIQEIRDAIIAFGETGKRTVVFAPSFGEMGGGLGAYYLASAFKEIHMQPTGEVGVAGVSVESPYFRKALEKIGVHPSFGARYEYKTGADSLTAEKMSAAERENLKELIDGFLTQAAADIGKARAIPAERMKKILTDGPYFADTTLNMRLVDKTGYIDALEDEVREQYADMADFFDYAYATEPRPSAKDDVFALIPAIGTIQTGDSVFGGGAYASVLGTATFSGNLRDAADDETVKAIIVRLDSPGGGYIPSDTMWRELNYVKSVKNKPVVCSIASMAASGGYFISLGCDAVFAEPSAITGSIGVFGGKMVFKNLLAKLDIAVSSVNVGKNAGLISPAADFTPEQRKFFEQSLDRVYADFTAKVAERRGFDAKKLDKIARGRVFTGAQAVENGLIDGIGGLTQALEKAAELSGVKVPLPLIEYPIQPTRFEMLSDFLMSGKLKTTGIVPKFKSLLKRDFRVFFDGFSVEK